jgi:type I restriction enzyme M protein
MLDQQTKKRIDDCRNILVGKITDPKSQVEQITIALIYKFMDDMDTEAVEMGGVPTYFVGEYERYSWKNIFSPRIGGDEMLQLYGEGMVKMNQNPNLPQLFRDIFKNAYLPYRDPETLKLFLKTINDFKYDHSERLGDAFEYLLSVLGSQGDAGQFRTPRHIIDFIVKIIDPKKNETMADPACGTSGFLISGYKHILQSNTNKVLGDKLTPEERKKLMTNVTGFDISPDMVRLSLVNLFLHGFTNPKVFEYDTLTSEDRWNEYFDVILANPPFMSPKGGIRPHKRFGIESNRAEVLFVDYIMEHLTPKGRAGIVVPEGIIFQSGTAYKSLRKMMVDKYLVGVVSLPSGVFNPYSGVKTSILVLDRELSQNTDKIFFAKVENDGFDLGAQRREIDKTDLPVFTEEITSYLNGLRSGKEVECKKLNFVSKEKILESNDVGLSYDRYTSKILFDSEFELIKLGDVCDFEGGSQPPKDNFIYEPKDGYIRFIQIRDYGERGKETYIPISKRNKICDIKDILIGRYGASVGKICRGLSGAFNVALIKCIINKDRITNDYLFHLLKSNVIQEKIIELSDRAAQAGINPEHLKDTLIPLPPIEVQDEIVKELEQYQKIIDGAKQVVDNYKPVIDIDPSWEMKELGEVCLVIAGQSPKSENYNEKGVGLPFYQGRTDFGDTYLKETNNYTSQITKTSKLGDVVMSVRAPVGPVNLTPFDICIGRGLCAIRPNDKILLQYIFYYLMSHQEIIIGNSGAIFDSINREQIEKLLIGVPPIEIQQSIVDRIESERQIIEGNKRLIEIYTQKIQDRINKIWGE